MRVIAGTKKRYGLKTTKGLVQRPTTDRIKETLFNMLQDEITGCVFVDLCAGSGQIGIEALSRGAKKAYFFEHDKNAVAVIQQNLEHTDFVKEARIIQTLLPKGLSRIVDKEENMIFFMDPPYESNLNEEILKQLSVLQIGGEDSLYIIETSKHSDLSYIETLGYQIERQKVYKSNQHIFLRRKDIS